MWTSSIDVDTFAEIASNLFLIKKYAILLMSQQVKRFKEQLIRSLADKLSISHKQCESTSIKSLFNRLSCLGLDVSKVEEILKKMP